MSLSAMARAEIVIVGNRGGTNVGECFLRATTGLGYTARLMEAKQAMEAPGWLRRFNWYFRGHRPSQLEQFSEQLVRECLEQRPGVVVTTGLAPITSSALERLRTAGVRVVNYLTDDPWNPAHRAPWFMKALPGYELVFTPRRAN